MKLKNLNMNEKDTYNIVVVKTGEVVGKCRLKLTATEMIKELKQIIIEELEVQKVK